MAERSVALYLKANVTDFRRQMDLAAKSTEEVGKKAKGSGEQANTSLGRLAKSANDNREAWDRSGTALTAFGAVTVGALGASVKAAIDWESAWAGVTKTVSGTPAELAKVESGLRQLSRTMPASQTEIAGVAEAAGQLGVKTGSVVAFTKTMVDLGETTNLSADEAATSLAQLMNVMQTAPDDVGRLGASLVALGNAGASTEADIVNMASYLTGSAKLIGASESDVLALANAMTSMGINAERGGGVMTRVMQDVYAAVTTGGDKLTGFAEVAGMSAQDFAAAFREDPVRAIDSFVQGLNGVESSGGNVVATLDELGYKGTQDTAVLLQMKGAGDLLTESLDLGNASWAENTALLAEAEKRYGTTASQLAIAQNNIRDAGIEIGETFLPAIASASSAVADFAGWIADLPTPVKEIGGTFAVAAGGASLIGGALLLTVPRILETVRAFQTLSTTMPGATGAMKDFGKAAGAIGAVVAVTSIVDALTREMVGAPATIGKTAEALVTLGESTEDVDAIIRGTSDNWRWQFDGLADAASQLSDPSLNQRLSDVAGTLKGIITLDPQQGADGRDALIRQLGMMGDELGTLVTEGHVDVAADRFRILSAEWVSGGGKLTDLQNLMPGYQEALDKVAADQKVAEESATGMAVATGAAAGAVAGITPAVESTYGSLAAYAASLGLDEAATQNLIDKTSELGSSLAAFADPLGTYTALMGEKEAAEQKTAQATADATESTTDSWEGYVGAVTVSVAEYLTKLEEQVAAQQAWQENMLRLAARVSQGTLDELARMGPEGAPLVAELVTASDAELARLETVYGSRTKAATDAWGEQLTLAQPVLAQIGRTAGQGVVDQLAEKLRAGTTTVAEIARQYGVELADGVNPVIVSLGGRKVNVNQQAGRGYTGPTAYADGGVENHVAQIAPGGAYRLWAEDETGGEAYIPLAASKRGRSTDIWREVGKRLGVQFEEFAYGGIRDVPRPRSTAPYQPPISTAGDTAMDRAYREVTSWLEDNLEPVLTGGSGVMGATGPMTGSLVAFGRRLQAMGARVSEHPAFGGVEPVHSKNSAHYSGRAIDVNTRAGTSALEQRELAPMRDLARASGFKTIFMAPGHYNHLHVAMKQGGILNPHIRDTGGPLLPGFTFNGTGAPEVVVDPRTRFHDARSSGGGAVVVAAPPGPMRIEGVLDLGDGLTGYINGVVDQRDNAAGDYATYGG